MLELFNAKTESKFCAAMLAQDTPSYKTNNPVNNHDLVSNVGV